MATAPKDLLTAMPTDASYPKNEGDVEVLTKIFSPTKKEEKSTTETTASKVSEKYKNKPNFSTNLKLSIIAGLLFLVLSLPFFSKLIEGWVKNSVFAKLIVAVLFSIIFFIIHQFWM